MRFPSERDHLFSSGRNQGAQLKNPGAGFPRDLNINSFGFRLYCLTAGCHRSRFMMVHRLASYSLADPLREFLYSDDMVDACVYLMNLPEAHNE